MSPKSHKGIFFRVFFFKYIYIYFNKKNPPKMTGNEGSWSEVEISESPKRYEYFAGRFIVARMKIVWDAIPILP